MQRLRMVRDGMKHAYGPRTEPVFVLKIKAFFKMDIVELALINSPTIDWIVFHPISQILTDIF
jgi:hypothetical protein